jgi:hypothetical protein
MMDRNSLLEKIRALMSKTTENGCTEAEALAALDKARALMDAYEVTDEDLQLSKAEAAVCGAARAFAPRAEDNGSPPQGRKQSHHAPASA